jgi:prepilin-type N-terminal cleavage/methylation domain-containing protein
MKHKGFTVVELIIVVVVIGILAGITVVGYGAWRERAAKTEVSSDLRNAALAMNNYRNFDNEYPSDKKIPDSFKASQNVIVTYVSGDKNSYCINGKSKSVPSVAFNVNSTQGSQVNTGKCAGSDVWQIPENPSLAYNWGCTSTTPACTSFLTAVIKPVDTSIAPGQVGEVALTMGCSSMTTSCGTFTATVNIVDSNFKISDNDGTTWSNSVTVTRSLNAGSTASAFLSAKMPQLSIPDSSNYGVTIGSISSSNSLMNIKTNRYITFQKNT